MIPNLIVGAGETDVHGGRDVHREGEFERVRVMTWGDLKLWSKEKRK